MSKLNLLIDFNNILMRSLSTPGTIFYNSKYDNDNDLNDIIKKITIDICYTLRLFNPDKVIILCDSSNAWRKDFLSGDNGYKANRKKDDEKDWNNLWKSIESYLEHLDLFGFSISKINRAEADDLAALWKDELFVKGSDNILFISSDKDWRQLIDFDNIKKTFCAIFNPTINSKGRKKLFITAETENYLSNNNISINDKMLKIFGDDASCSAKSKIKDGLKNDSKIDIEIIDPFDILIHKIFEGDDGDNVPSYYDFYKTTKRGTISTGVTARHVNKLQEKINTRNTNILLESHQQVKSVLEDVMQMELPVDSYDRLHRQIVLVELRPSLFPDNIVNQFNEKSVYLMSKTFNIDLKNIRWKDVLNGTTFYNKEIDEKPIVNAVFDDFGVSDFDKYFKNLF